MAKLRSFITGERDVKEPQTEIDGYVQTVVGADGTLYLYLYNYAEGGPVVGSSPTQSMHFDVEAARAFKKILEATFGSL